MMHHVCCNWMCAHRTPSRPPTYQTGMSYFGPVDMAEITTEVLGTISLLLYLVAISLFYSCTCPQGNFCMKQLPFHTCADSSSSHKFSEVVRRLRQDTRIALVCVVFCLIGAVDCCSDASACPHQSADLTLIFSGTMVLSCMSHTRLYLDCLLPAYPDLVVQHSKKETHIPDL